jgi:hypothetical protein
MVGCQWFDGFGIIFLFVIYDITLLLLLLLLK